MPSTFSYEWNTEAFKGKTSFNTGLFIGGKFVDGSNKTTIEYGFSPACCSYTSAQYPRPAAL
jgi:hypothetical protein